MNRRNILLIGASSLALSACGAGYIEVEELAMDSTNPQIDPMVVPGVTPSRYSAAYGDIVVDTARLSLFHFRPDGTTVMYPVAVGNEGSSWTGVEYITRKAVWPSWTPTTSMIRRNPALYAKHAGGMPGGPNNPMGSRALYLGNTFYRIHGTNDPARIGGRISNGCINMHNRHVEHLYDHVPLHTKVIVV